jgi:protein gp37
MGANSKIEWTHHTFNPWRGCTKVSAGCANCYAERQSVRNPKVLGIWGDDGTRVIAAEAYWKEPLKWNKAAQLAGERHRVFCASLADIFEDRPELDKPRDRLLELIDATDNLDWLLLTKRPENFIIFLPRSWHEYPRKNVWLGVSVEDQKNADERIPELLATPAHIRFLSAEPLLGALRLDEIRGSDGFSYRPFEGDHTGEPRIHWVIGGGESGPRARPMHPAWARSLRDQCTSGGVAFHFKQWGEFAPALTGASVPDKDKIILGGNGHARQIGAESLYEDDVIMANVGKHAAGRLLDGREWNEFPKPAEVSA